MFLIFRTPDNLIDYRYYQHYSKPNDTTHRSVEGAETTYHMSWWALAEIALPEAKWQAQSKNRRYGRPRSSLDIRRRPSPSIIIKEILR